MKQIFCRFGAWAARPRNLLLGVFAVLVLPGLAAGAEKGGETFLIAGPTREDRLTLHQLEALGAREIASAYFDRALGYSGSRFRAVEFARLIERYDPGGVGDAVLLDCFDDYQGLIAVEDIRRYRLGIATRIEILSQGAVIPGWLNPLLILVPDGSAAPPMERFLTANIRAIRFVKKADYYAPLEKLAAGAPAAREGMKVFKDNCLFCHALKGVGGGKGGGLPARFDFSGDAGAFYRAFAATHSSDNPDKQSIAQFVNERQLAGIAALLKAASP
ncbi:MAG: hypothetical protein JSU88_00240 [Nitrospinaceae bacterium]|jgi:mono/diheme cytochrome c family protein|nr:MAG: hypothetical protein JSU88_00240 [Nitrospinaceae bacterium]